MCVRRLCVAIGLFEWVLEVGRVDAVQGGREPFVSIDGSVPVETPALEYERRLFRREVSLDDRRGNAGCDRVVRLDVWILVAPSLVLTLAPVLALGVVLVSAEIGGVEAVEIEAAGTVIETLLTSAVGDGVGPMRARPSSGAPS
ncbi:hypothetical protein ACFQMM_20845 [Saliphagus sp. GCM10025308]